MNNTTFGNEIGKNIRILGGWGGGGGTCIQLSDLNLAAMLSEHGYKRLRFVRGSFIPFVSKKVNKNKINLPHINQLIWE